MATAVVVPNSSYNSFGNTPVATAPSSRDIESAPLDTTPSAPPMERTNNGHSLFDC